MTNTDTRPQFVKIEPVEKLALLSERKGWRGSPLAEIRLGQYGDGWAFATAFQQMGGDSWGGSSPLGFWTGSEGPSLFSTRAEALTAGVARLRAILTKRPVELRQQLAWLDTLLAPAPQQLDLFG